MCRIFGFRSILESHMHESLVLADNALCVQSKKHPDGWGIAYYVENTPHVIKSEKAAREDELYPRVSSIVSSNTVIAHIRRATLGKKTILNTHPFQYGPWVFAHNGHIKDFEKHKNKLLQLISSEQVKYILGSTDSEFIFYILLSQCSKNINIFDPKLDFNIFVGEIKKALHLIQEIVGPCVADEINNDKNFLTFVLTNGKITLAHHGGKKLYYSTYKSKCGERNVCPFFNENCEQESKTGNVNHFLVSSEKLETTNIWLDLEMGELVGVDQNMNFHRTRL